MSGAGTGMRSPTGPGSTAGAGAPPARGADIGAAGAARPPTGSIALRENPIPVLLVLAALFGFIEYLHWSVVSREDRPLVVQVPSAPPASDAAGAGDETGMGSSGGALAVDPAGVAGPVHAAARELAGAGRLEEALQRLDASLSSEGGPGAARLHERGVLLLRLGRPAEALAALKEARRADDPSAALSYNMALALARTGDATGAEAMYRRALQINPRFDEAWNNLGLLLERREDRPAAVDALRQAVDLAQPSARHRALTNLARLLDRSGRRDEAVALLEEAIRLAPAEPSPRLALAALMASSPAGLPRARDLYQQVIRIAPTDPEGRFQLGQLEGRLGDPAAAERGYLEALELQPGHRRARYGLATLMLESGRAAEAARQFEILREQSPEARASFGLGRARRATGDAPGAESAYREALRLAGGRYPEALYNLGILLGEGGRAGEAEEAYRAALAQDSGYTAAWINLALLLADRGKPAEALEAIDRATAINPAGEKAWFVRGRLLSELGRREEALSAYLRAAALRPGYSKAMLNAAVLHADLGRVEEAIRLYREVLAIDPRNAAAWYNLGLASRRVGRDAEARAAYEEALRADPESTRAAQNLGVLYAREGRIEEARRVFADALHVSPQDVGLRYNLALQLDKLGRTGEALREVQRVVSLEPDHARGWRLTARLLDAIGKPEEAARARRKSEELGSRKLVAEEAEP